MRTLLHNLKTWAEKEKLPWYEPIESPDDEEFSWWRKDRSLIIYYEKREWHYLKSHLNENRKIMQEEGLLDTAGFIDLYRWLYDI